MSDAGLRAYRELGDVLDLSALAGELSRAPASARRGDAPSPRFGNPSSDAAPATRTWTTPSVCGMIQRGGQFGAAGANGNFIFEASS